jgi:hypothetical protein
VIFLAIMMLVAGCKTIEPTGIEVFSTGVTAAKTQTHLSLVTVAQIIREDSIDYAAAKENLSAANLVSTPDAQTIAAWDELFTTLEQYAANLSTLAAAQPTKAFQDSMVTLAEQFRNTSKKLNDENPITKTPQLATAFTEAAALIMKWHAQAEARKIAVEVDPQMTRIFTGLAEAVGNTDKDGLRRTVLAHWDLRLAEKQAQFLNTSNLDVRKRITREFADLLDKRDAQDLALASLRRSFLALADAHHAVALGHYVSLCSAVAAVSDELKNTKELHDRFTAKLQK